MDRQAIERAARIAGLAVDADLDISIDGADPVLPTPFHLGEGAAVALALVGQEADRIWRMRGGRRQSLAVSVEHAAASLHSHAALEVAGFSPNQANPEQPFARARASRDRRPRTSDGRRLIAARRRGSRSGRPRWADGGSVRGTLGRRGRGAPRLVLEVRGDLLEALPGCGKPRLGGRMTE